MVTVDVVDVIVENMLGIEALAASLSWLVLVLALVLLVVLVLVLRMV